MLFQRRQPAGTLERLRTALWPRRSFRRSLRYFAKRALRLAATPHAIGAGVAIGVFTSFLPVPGFHFVLAALLAWLLAGNIVASALGTAFGNPLTFPLIWGGTYEIGRLMLHGPAAPPVPHDIRDALGSFRIAEIWEPVLKPMLVGSIPLGIVFGVVFYVATRWAAARFQARRRERFAQRAAEATQS